MKCICSQHAKEPGCLLTSDSCWEKLICAGARSNSKGGDKARSVLQIPLLFVGVCCTQCGVRIHWRRATRIRCPKQSPLVRHAPSTWVVQHGAASRGRHLVRSSFQRSQRAPGWPHVGGTRSSRTWWSAWRARWTRRCGRRCSTRWGRRERWQRGSFAPGAPSLPPAACWWWTACRAPPPLTPWPSRPSRRALPAPSFPPPKCTPADPPLAATACQTLTGLPVLASLWPSKHSVHAEF